MAESKRQFCLYLRTKTAYFRTPDGERMFDPESSTACYTCLKTQRPFGPDARPAHADSCGTSADRNCFEKDV
jgi:hypothetical protein